MKLGKQVITFLFSLWIAACSLDRTPLTPLGTASPSLAPTHPEISTSTVTAEALLVTPSYTPPVTSPYEIISPLAVRKDGIVVEVVSYTIADSIFRFGIKITGFDPSQIPADPESTFSPISEVTFFTYEGGETSLLEVELVGGGGGGGQNEDGTVTINQDFAYRLVRAFPTGKPLHVIAVVTLHPIFGITEPIRFDLEIVPQEGIQG